MLMRTDPFRELDRLTHQVLGTAARPAAMPMDAWRQGDSFYICLDLPGINPDSIDLTVEQNVLTVRAERAPVQADGAQMIVAERPYGTFTRQVFLGETLDTNHVAADYAAGVLTLTIPVHEAAKPAASRSPAATPSRLSPPSPGYSTPAGGPPPAGGPSALMPVQPTGSLSRLKSAHGIRRYCARLIGDGGRYLGGTRAS